MAVCKPGGEPSPETKPASTLSWTSSPCNHVTFLVKSMFNKCIIFTKETLVRLLQESLTSPFVYDFLFSLKFTGMISCTHHEVSPQTPQKRCKILLSTCTHISSICSLEPCVLLLPSGLVIPHPAAQRPSWGFSHQALNSLGLSFMLDPFSRSYASFFFVDSLILVALLAFQNLPHVA